MPAPASSPSPNWFRRTWGRLSPRMQGLVKNLCVGVGIWCVLLLFQDSARLRRFEDTGFDWIMRMAAGTGVHDTGNRFAFALLDIDERTYRRWDEPFFTDRAKLCRLIRYGVDNGARLIIVDVEVSRPGGPGDEVLREYLTSLDYSADSPPPPILLARGLRHPLGLGEDSKNTLEARPSFLDRVVAESPGLFWASTLFDLEPDGQIRRWRLWEDILPGDSEAPKTLLSFQVLAGLLLLGDDLSLAAPDLFLSQLNNQTEQLQVGPHTFEPAAGRMERRIIYSIPWHLAEDERYPDITLRGEAAPLLYVRPAYTVTEIDAPPPDPSLAGRVLIIGASHAESRDVHATPLGSMPGPMIILNSVDTFLRFGAVKKPPLVLRLLIIMALILVMSVCFQRFSSFLGMVLSALVVVLALIPLTFWLFRDGFWIDFAVPLIAVQVYKIVDEFRKTALRGRNTPCPSDLPPEGSPE
ncbi:MAG: CHASE2 domain-containing protein [Desulfovibrio sp.]|nr:MAG: CHASE2 domain-containing protein [Desulfovibrio sp.]